jgi:hypothetical protein
VIAPARNHRDGQEPRLPRTPEATRKARRRRERKVGDLFEHRLRFAKRQLTPAERRTLQRISRGVPQLRALRKLVEEIDRLFDRRCPTETTLTKRARPAGSRPPLQGTLRNFFACQIFGGLSFSWLMPSLTSRP